MIITEEKSKAAGVSHGGSDTGGLLEPGSTDGDFEALQQIIRALGRVRPEHRLRVLQSAMTFFGMNEAGVGRVLHGSAPHNLPTKAGESGGVVERHLDFSTRQNISPKEFMKDKQPQTDVERVACLAYYLAHYRDAPHFKTLDLSKVNTEAAQPKFANAAYAVNNALNSGYLAPAPKGLKQLSAAGEQFVQLLPDREAARTAMANARTRRKGRKGGNKEPRGGGNES
jgi:hypothetical protein